MTGCVELINTGRGPDGDGLRDLAGLQTMADRYAFAGIRARQADMAKVRDYRARLAPIVTGGGPGD